MDDFLKGFDFKKGLLIVLYLFCAIFVANFFDYIISFGNDVVYQRVSTMKGFGIFKIMIFLLLIMMPLFLLKKDSSGGSKLEKKYGNQGTAKEGSVGELRDLIGKENGLDGFVLSKNIRMSAKKSYEHVLILGPTGAGKSTSFFIPNLLDLDGVHSAVVTDPKGEMHELTSPYLEKLGYNIIKITPLEPLKSQYYYNPLFIAEDATQVREVSQLLMINGGKSIELATGGSSGGAEWLSMSTPLLSAALIYVKENGVKKTINEALDIILNSDLKTMELLFKENPAAYKSFLIFKQSSGSEKTLSSIKTTLTTNLQLFIDEKIEDFTQTPFKGPSPEYGVNYDKLFNPKILREKPTVLFVCVPEIKSLYMMPLMSIFYSQLLDVTMSNKEGQPILYYLDEFANIGVIPSISNVTATARSRRIGISLALQGVEQLKRNYGEENAADILNNLKAKVVFSGLTGDSAQYVSDLAGVTTIETTNYSRNQGGNQDPLTGLFSNNLNVSKSGTRRELITPDEVRRMDENEVLIIAHNKNMVRDKKNIYYEQKKYTQKLQK